MLQQPGVRQLLGGGEPDVREAAPDHDAVEQSRVVVGRLVCLVRPAGAAPTHRVAGQTVGLDELLARHAERLGGQQVAAVVAEDVERVRCDGEPTGEHRVVEDAAGAGSLLVPAGTAAAPEGVDEPVVPGAVVPERARGRSEAGVVQDGELVDAPVHRPRLDADDVGGPYAVEGLGVGDVRRERVTVGERLERPTRGPVDVVDPGGHGTVLVKGLAEVLPRHGQELAGLAVEGLLLGTGEHGPGSRVGGDLHRARAGASGGCRQRVLPRRQPVEDRDEVTALDPERAGDVAAVQQRCDPAGTDSLRHLDADQGVPTRDGVRSAGQDLDLQGGSRGGSPGLGSVASGGGGCRRKGERQEQGGSGRGDGQRAEAGSGHGHHFRGKADEVSRTIHRRG